MNVLRLSADFERYRLVWYTWPRDLSWPMKIGLALVLAALTGLAAQVRIPLPHTPVPMTGQVFVVLLSGAWLGGAWGGLSQSLYVGLGALGVPWFSRWSAGIPDGPTAGYLMGFIVAASLVGWASDRFVWMRFFVAQAALMMVGVQLIWTFGAVGFYLTTGFGFAATVQQAILPFVVIDTAKAIAAAALSSALLPKRSSEAFSNGRC